jgi:hypothetical protein
MRLLLIAAVLPLAACQSNWEKQGTAAAVSGSGASRSFAARDFTRVDLRGPDDVEVKTGAAFAVTAQGDPKVLDQLDIRLVDGALRVERKDDKWNWGGDKGARILVVLPRLAGANLAGSGNMTIDRADRDFSGNIAGSGNMTVAALQGGKASFNIAGSGDLAVAGQVDRLEAAIAGSGDIDAERLVAASADISIAGSGNVRGVVRGDASVSLVGSGDVRLSGGARCKVSAFGSGEAHCS